MCDYSLAHLPNRLAVEGEKLVVHRFSTHSRGLTSARRSWKQILLPETRPAVCVPPGARLRLLNIPDYLRRQLGVGPIEHVTFVQQSMEAFRYRDGVRFCNGREILLQCLPCGQEVEVLSLECADEHVSPAKREQEERVYRHASD